MVHTVAQEVRVHQHRIGRRQSSVVMEEHGAGNLWYLADKLIFPLLRLCLLRLLLENILLQARISLADDPFHCSELSRLLLYSHVRVCLVARCMDTECPERGHLLERVEVWRSVDRV